jgi:hypothetical protein
VDRARLGTWILLRCVVPEYQERESLRLMIRFPYIFLFELSQTAFNQLTICAEMPTLFQDRPVCAAHS